MESHLSQFILWHFDPSFHICIYAFKQVINFIKAANIYHSSGLISHTFVTWVYEGSKVQATQT